MNLKTTIALILLATVAGFIVLFINPFEKSAEPEQTPPWFYNVSSDDIERIEIRSQGSTVSFTKVSPGRWRFEDPEDIPVDPERWGGVPTLLSGPQSQRLLYQSVDDLAPFGLVEPTTIVDVTLDSGQVLEVRLGDETPDGAAHYSQMGGFPQIFLIDSSWGRVLSRIATEPPIPKWYILERTQRISSIEVSYEGAEVAFEKDENGWQFKDGGVIASDRWSEVLSLLDISSLLGVVEDQVNDPSSYGINDESSFISLRWKATTERGVEYTDTISFVLGDESPEDNGRFVYVDGYGIVLLLDTHWAEVLSRLAEDPPYTESS